MREQFDTPILFLIFNRPDTTQQVFNQIRKVKPKYLYVAADGPRLNNNQDIESCAQTRNIINQIDWDCEVKTLFRAENLGCRIAVSSAISWFFNNVEQGIILEDDCLPDLSFFSYCEELLDYYANDERIYQINGTNFQYGENKIENSYYFSRYPIIWGWATWKRAWEKYDLEMNDFKEFHKMDTIKSILGTTAEQNHFNKVFKKMLDFNVNTWDRQWWFSIMKNNGVVIVPNTNLVINIGYDNNSTHSFLKDSKRTTNISGKMDFPLVHAPFLINTKADGITFQNVWSYSPKRIYRVVKENGVLNVIIHTVKKKLFKVD